MNRRQRTRTPSKKPILTWEEKVAINPTLKLTEHRWIVHYEVLFHSRLTEEKSRPMPKAEAFNFAETQQITLRANDKYDAAARVFVEELPRQADKAASEDG